MVTPALPEAVDELERALKALGFQSGPKPVPGLATLGFTVNGDGMNTLLFEVHRDGKQVIAGMAIRNSAGEWIELLHTRVKG